VKKDKLKIFSVLAGILLLLAALIDCGRLVVDVVFPVISGGGFSVATLIGIIPNFAKTVCFIAPAIAAAIILFVKKDSVAVFISLGLLSYTFFYAIFGFGSTILFNLLFRFVSIAMSAVGSLVSIVNLIISVVCAVIVTAIFCIPAATFLKKRRFILAFILAGLFLVGSVAVAAASAVDLIASFGVLDFYLATPFAVSIIYQRIVSPILYALPRVLLFVPVILAAIGMIGSCPKSCAACEEIEESDESENQEA
jgi:hypothetical protein